MEILFKLIKVEKPIVKKNKICYDPDVGGEKRIYRTYEIKLSIIGIVLIKKFIGLKVFLRPYNGFYNSGHNGKQKFRLSGTWLEPSRDYISYLHRGYDIDFIIVNQLLQTLLFKNQMKKFKYTIIN